ncbi:MAG: GPW/gp25 family protein [Tannerellaceae bacterium]|nr:GPW/gp25 family protein [Tannerellaceae bacterium]
MEDKPYLGTGWGFPVRFNKKTGVQMVYGEEDIRQSFSILFSTLPGSRIFRFEYGCNINQWVFEQINETQKTEIERNIRKAILDGEPRIDIEKVIIDCEDISQGILHIHLDYNIRQTNSRSNMVYPFYLNEGTNI